MLGGILFKEAKALPQDLQSHMDGCSQGVILVSMGTVATLTSSELRSLAGGLSRLQHCILWKLERSELPGTRFRYEGQCAWPGLRIWGPEIRPRQLARQARRVGLDWLHCCTVSCLHFHTRTCSYKGGMESRSSSQRSPGCASLVSGLVCPIAAAYPRL